MGNNYPHYLLYQDGDKAKETLENRNPEGADPFDGSVGGPPRRTDEANHGGINSAVMQASDPLSAATAQFRLAEMRNSGNLLGMFDEEIANVPTETVLAMAQVQLRVSG